MKRLLFIWLAVAALLASLLFYVLGVRPQASNVATQITPGNYCSPTPAPDPTSSDLPDELPSGDPEPECTPKPTANPNGPRCENGKDDDNDGKIDYPADTGCFSRTDQSEDPNPQCSDGIDNDRDGKIDVSDPDCFRRVVGPNNSVVVVYEARDNDESGSTSIVIPSPTPKPPTPTPPKPPTPTPTPTPKVSPTPPKVSPSPSPSPSVKPSPTISSSKSQCSDGRDNDNDKQIDYPKDYGCASLTDNSEDDEKECGDAKDNDEDSLIDNQDKDCYRKINGQWHYVARTFPERGTKGEGPPPGSDPNDILNPSPSPSGGVTPPATNPSPTPTSTGGGGNPQPTPTPPARPVQVLVEGRVIRGKVTGLPFNSTVRIDLNARVTITATQADLPSTKEDEPPTKRIKIVARGGAQGRVRFGIIGIPISARVNQTQYMNVPVDVSDSQAMAFAIPAMMGQAQTMIPQGLDVDIIQKTGKIYPPYVAKLKFSASFRAKVGEIRKLAKNPTYQDVLAFLDNERLEITTENVPAISIPGLFP